MIRLAVSQAAFAATAETLPLGSVGYEPALNAKGERMIWVEMAVADRLTACAARAKPRHRRPNGRKPAPARSCAP